MRARLEAGTDAGVFVVFDPDAVQHLIHADYDSWFERIDEEARATNLMVYTCGGDGEVSLEVVLDEAPDPSHLAHVRRSEHGLLKVPSGRLSAAGMEYLSPKRLASLDRLETPWTIAIPPGVYRVDAHDLDFGEAPQLAAERAAEATSSPWMRRLDLATGVAGGLMFAGTIFALIPFLLMLWCATNFHFVWDVIVQYGPWYLACAAAIVLLRRVKGVRDLESAVSDSQSAFPDLLLVLTPAPEPCEGSGVALHI